MVDRLQQGLLAIAGLVILFLFLKFLKSFLANKNRRYSDQRIFTRNEKAIYRNAKKLMRAEKIVAAAQLLESINLTREAVSALEDHGYIDEAANILLKMQLPHRAAALYFRSKDYKKAATYFRQANLPLEVARCEKAAGNFQAAAESFLIGELYPEAAECFVQLQDFRNAAKYYAKGNNKTRAVEYFYRLQENSKDAVRFNLETYETDMIFELICQGLDLGLAGLLAQPGKLVDAILLLTEKGQIADACKVYQRAKVDIAEELVRRVEGNKTLAEACVQLFVNLGNTIFAGVISEKLGDWEKAENFYQQAGFTEGVERCRKTLKKDPEPPVAAPVVVEKDKVPKAGTPSLGSIPMVASFIRSFLLSDLTQAEKQSFWDIGFIDEYAAGEWILEPGKPPEGLYFVISGSVELSFPQSLKPMQNIKCCQGDTMGLPFVLIGDHANFVAKALEESSVLVIPAKAFEELLDSRGSIARKLYKTFLSQSREFTATGENIRTFLKVV